MLELSARDARRLAVRAQLLTRQRPVDLAAVAAGLGAIQEDLTAYLAPNAELVPWSRLGDAFAPGDLPAALDRRALVEIAGFLRPAADVALFTAEMAAWPGPEPSEYRRGLDAWVEDNRYARAEILDQLRADGPLSARDLHAGFARDWRSSGWNNTKNIPMMLERLAERGEVAVSRRDGRERVWDLAARVYPDEPPIPVEAARAERARRRLHSLGIARATGPAHPDEPQHVNAAGLAARVAGVRGTWRVDPDLLETPFVGRTAIIGPLDRLVFDRKRMDELFDFDYALEMYKPAHARRWGYYALPVLHQDRLVGKVDAQADRTTGVLRVHAIHEDEPWSAALRAAVGRELNSLARMLGLARG